MGRQQQMVPVPFGVNGVANHILPAHPVQAFKSYVLASPVDTHFRPATCQEVECAGYTKGWVSAFDGTDPEDVPKINWVRDFCDRQFTEHRGVRVPKLDGGTAVALDDAGPLTVFVFPPGQMCFEAADHRMTLEREPLYVVRDGDWRGNPTGRVREHANGDDFVDDFGEHQDKLADQAARG